MGKSIPMPMPMPMSKQIRHVGRGKLMERLRKWFMDVYTVFLSLGGGGGAHKGHVMSCRTEQSKVPYPTHPPYRPWTGKVD